MAKKVYRTDQVGSLLRPQKLMDARDKHKHGKCTDAELDKIIDASILDALQRQKDIGVEIYTDGEMRRDAWQTGFAHAVDGFDPKYPILELKSPDGSVAKLQMHTQIINGKIRRKGRLTEREAQFLKKNSPGPFKVTMPSPNYIARMGYRSGITDKIYPDQGQLHSDVTEVVRQEMKALVADGTAYIQLDEGFVYYVSETAQTWATVTDIEKALLADIAAENSCYDAVRDEVTVAMHVCRGSRTSWMHGAKGYDWLAERLFTGLNVDRFLLEYDLDYENGFEPLRFLPKGKVAVLGLISSKEPRIENADEIARRIDEAAKFCSLDQLAVTSQCGFQAAADPDGAHISYEQQWRKIEVMMQVARNVWA
jgi:5-methyltetrahydropteroyltriglutamate--homocysteine methyltransferase